MLTFFLPTFVASSLNFLTETDNKNSSNFLPRFWPRILFSNFFFQLGIYFLMPSSNNVSRKTFLEDFFQCHNLVVDTPAQQHEKNWRRSNECSQDRASSIITNHHLSHPLFLISVMSCRHNGLVDGWPRTIWDGWIPPVQHPNRPVVYSLCYGVLHPGSDNTTVPCNHQCPDKPANFLQAQLIMASFGGYGRNSINT